MDYSQVPLSTRYSRQEYWGGLPCAPPADFPDPGIEPVSPVAPALHTDSKDAQGVSYSAGQEWGLRICISNKFPGNAAAAWPQAPTSRASYLSYSVQCSWYASWWLDVAMPGSLSGWSVAISAFFWTASQDPPWFASDWLLCYSGLPGSWPSASFWLTKSIWIWVFTLALWALTLAVLQVLSQCPIFWLFIPQTAQARCLSLVSVPGDLMLAHFQTSWPLEGEGVDGDHGNSEDMNASQHGPLASNHSLTFF